jgi:hypothetical protein
MLTPRSPPGELLKERVCCQSVDEIVREMELSRGEAW